MTEIRLPRRRRTQLERLADIWFARRDPCDAAHAAQAPGAQVEEPAMSLKPPAIPVHRGDVDPRLVRLDDLVRRLARGAVLLQSVVCRLQYRFAALAEAVSAKVGWWGICAVAVPLGALNNRWFPLPGSDRYVYVRARRERRKRVLVALIFKAGSIGQPFYKLCVLFSEVKHFAARREQLLAERLRSLGDSDRAAPGARQLDDGSRGADHIVDPVEGAHGRASHRGHE